MYKMNCYVQNLTLLFKKSGKLTSDLFLTFLSTSKNFVFNNELQSNAVKNFTQSAVRSALSPVGRQCSTG